MRKSRGKTMQQIDLIAAKTAKAADRKALAILAYETAKADPAGANWQGIADLLRLALPPGKAKAADDIAAADSKYAAWADYVIPQSAGGKRLGKSPVVIVTFADGETVRAPAVSLPGKPVNIGRALRVALAFYQGRIVGRYNSLIPDDCGAPRLSVTDSEFVATIPVPAIVSCVCEATGAAYDPAACSAAISAQAAPAVAPAAPSVSEKPVAPLAGRFLVSSSLAAPIAGLPVAPSCAIRIAA
jgi:hypothetical protein